MVNFSDLSKAPNRVKEVREKRRVLKGPLSLDLERDKNYNKEEQRDRFFAVTSIVLEYSWKVIKSRMETNRPVLEFSLESFHDTFLKTYSQSIREQEICYGVDMFKRITDKIKLEGFEKLNQEERAYTTFLAEDLDKKFGPSALSNFDALFVIVHIAEVIQSLAKGDLDKFTKILNSKAVNILVNSLMINESGSISALFKFLCKGQKLSEHKNVDYSFSEEYSTLSEKGELSIDSRLVQAIREVMEKQNTEEVRRNCPASFDSKTANEIFDYVKGEVVYQYAEYLRQKINLPLAVNTKDSRAARDGSGLQ